MYILGASGHAKVIIDILSLDGDKLMVYDDRHDIKEILGVPVHSPLPQASSEKLGEGIIAIGDNKIRNRLAQKYLSNFDFINIIHSSAILSNYCSIGKGNVIMERAIVKADALIENHVIVNTGSIVEHDCVLGDFVHIAPGAVLCGHVEVGEGTLIGAGSTVLPSVKIGNWSIIAAGSVVHKNVPDFGVWIGDSLVVK